MTVVAFAINPSCNDLIFCHGMFVDAHTSPQPLAYIVPSLHYLPKKYLDMDNIISLEFMYKSKTYFALVRTKANGPTTKFYVTVMNGNLERLLFGNHIIVEENGVFLPGGETFKPQIAALKECLVLALCQHLQTNASLS